MSKECVESMHVKLVNSCLRMALKQPNNALNQCMLIWLIHAWSDLETT